MMTIGRHKVKSHMSMEYDFSGIRILEGSLIPVDWHISVDLVALDKKGGKSLEESEVNANIAYQKLYFWLETNLPNVVMVDVSNQNDLYIANLSSNIMMYCPEEPFDDIIVRLLHCKLSVLADNNLLVGEIRIKSTDMTVQYSFEPNDLGYNLAETTEEYYTETKTKDVEPWWLRNDGFCFEFVRPDDMSVSDEEFYKDIIDPLTEFSVAIQEMSDKTIGAVREPARIVQVEKWKPKKV